MKKRIEKIFALMLVLCLFASGCRKASSEESGSVSLQTENASSATQNTASAISSASAGSSSSKGNHSASASSKPGSSTKVTGSSVVTRIDSSKTVTANASAGQSSTSKSQATSSASVSSGNTSSISVTDLFSPAVCRKTWVKTFEDDFSGNSLDRSKWDFFSLSDTRFYPSAYAVEDGLLKLKVLENDIGAPNRDTLNGGVWTANLFSQTYGYYEVRCICPQYYGINAAFWLFGGSMGDKVVWGGADGAEIDVLETHGFSSKWFQHAVHWDGYGENHGTVEMVSPLVEQGMNIYDGKFHTFGLLWTKDDYVFYVDDKVSYIPDSPLQTGGICRVPLWILLTVCPGGWVGEVDHKNLPCNGMQIDYCRVWQNPDYKSAGN